MLTLICEHCGEAYTPRKVYSDGVRGRFCSRRCKERRRNATPEHRAVCLRNYYQRRYGLTPDEADQLRMRGCDICGRHGDAAASRWHQLSIDHDHVTGAVRGVLCHGCNVAIGHFREDPDIMRAAIRYLLDFTP